MSPVDFKAIPTTQCHSLPVLRLQHCSHRQTPQGSCSGIPRDAPCPCCAFCSRRGRTLPALRQQQPPLPSLPVPFPTAPAALPPAPEGSPGTEPGQQSPPRGTLGPCQPLSGAGGPGWLPAQPPSSSSSSSQRRGFPGRQLLPPGLPEQAEVFLMGRDLAPSLCLLLPAGTGGSAGSAGGGERAARCSRRNSP